jgi:thiol-disulfide isomerase/thioredoxin
MTKRILVLATAGVAVAAMLLIALGNRDSAPNDAVAGPPLKSEPTKPIGPPEKARAASTLPDGADAAEVYGKLTQEIEAISRQAMASKSPEDQARAFAEMDAKLVAFRTKYPGTPESYDAAFQLGAMSFSAQKYDQAVTYLSEFIAKSDPTETEKQAYAHFYLAEAYKMKGNYDHAEAEYKLILSKYASVNPRLTQFVQGNLEGLESERKLAIGGEPVSFNVKSIDGKTLSPAAYKGKVLLIDFWATWCGPCIAEMPNVKQVYKKYHPKGFEIVGISLDQSRQKLDQYITSNQIEWPQYFDGKWWNNDVAVRYGIKSIPTTILVDRTGKIRYKSLRGKQLETAVVQLLDEKS